MNLSVNLSVNSSFQQILVLWTLFVNLKALNTIGRQVPNVHGFLAKTHAVTKPFTFYFLGLAECNLTTHRHGRHVIVTCQHHCSTWQWTRVWLGSSWASIRCPLASSPYHHSNSSWKIQLNIQVRITNPRNRLELVLLIS